MAPLVLVEIALAVPLPEDEPDVALVVLLAALVVLLAVEVALAAEDVPWTDVKYILDFLYSKIHVQCPTSQQRNR
jgi:hypothetical protein